MAKGGVVLPRQGGTVVRVAEAGQAERIEPLDADGLSKRDKALISYLSGGAGANGGGAGRPTINVYPTPGMSEIEVAHQVNRNLVKVIRRGV